MCVGGMSALPYPRLLRLRSRELAQLRRHKIHSRRRTFLHNKLSFQSCLRGSGDGACLQPPNHCMPIANSKLEEANTAQLFDAVAEPG